MSDQYAHVVKSSLKLKSKGPLDTDIKKKKKHHSGKNAEKHTEATVDSMSDVTSRRSTTEGMA